MLPLWRKNVRIVLCPDRVIVMQLQGGPHARIVSKQVIPHAGTETGWQPVLAILESLLKNGEWKKSDVTVILSNHFMRFLVLPWNEVSLTEVEQMALVQHHFAAVYGDRKSVV